LSGVDCDSADSTGEEAKTMIVDALLPRAELPAPSDDFWFGPYPSLDGSIVTPDTAMQVTAVLACVRVLAETIAQLPLHLMETDGQMRQQAISEPLYDVLHDRSNDWQTDFEFREMMQGHLALRGNAYSQIRPGPRGAVDQLIPLHPDRMQVFRLENNRIGYLYRDLQGKPYRLTQDEVFHLRFMSLNDCVGMSVIAAGRVAVELAQKGDDHGIKFYRNAARPSGVIKFPEGTNLTKDQHNLLKKSWREAHTGEDLFTVAILEAGADWEQMGLSNEDAQWLESRRFQTVEIARLFRVPPHMIGSAIEHGHTYANVEQSDIAFLKHTMMPWVTRWEKAINRDLVVQPADGRRLYSKFNVEGLLRADSTTRATFYGTMLDKGVYSVNEVREMEDRNPIEGGDEYNTAPSPSPVKQLPEAIPFGENTFTVGGDGASLPDVRVAIVEQREAELRDRESGLQEREAATAQLDVESARRERNLHRAWIADAAERIANHEIDRLDKRAEKAAGDRRKFNTWVQRYWGTTVREYAERTLAPILAACASPIASAPLADDLCERAITELTAGDPVEVLKRWKAERAAELTKLLRGDLDHDR
jgi:HK97 family phage portal protein